MSRRYTEYYPVIVYVSFIMIKTCFISNIFRKKKHFSQLYLKN